MLCCLPIDDLGGDGVAIIISAGFDRAHAEGDFKPGQAVALLADGQVLDAAAKLAICQQGKDRVGGAFLGG